MTVFVCYLKPAVNLRTSHNGENGGGLMESFQLQPCVWDLVKECVPDSELPEIKAVLGEGLIDMYTETYSEVQMWEQIWQKAQSEKRRPQITCRALADPPAVKDLLRAELQLLLLTLREKAARLGRDEDEVLSRYSPMVVSYALGGVSRKGSPSSRCESTSPPSRSASSLSRSGSRSVFIEECEVLKRDVQFLQESVELEYQTEREPTLTELKEERRIIQRDLDVHRSRRETSDKPKPSRDRWRTGTRADDPALENRSISPRMVCLYPNPPPPDSCRPVHSGKPRHRLSHRGTQPPASSPAGNPPQDLDPDHSHAGLSLWTSTAFSTESRSLPLSNSASSLTETHDGRPMRVAPSRQSPAAVVSISSAQLGRQTEDGRARTLLPTPPPPVLKVSSRGQRTGKRLTVPPAGSLHSSS
ncbi:coiled-coil domain-containing protein 24 isoform X3 [Hoplias malabaricus]|uniref:coiled-coil domain-containing protein 24 isoform X3 n=1 Tax=Hoplias malabaricus TaxID=27720 RepID=UPI00346301AE